MLFERFGNAFEEISLHYKEANIRTEFIDEFFRLLGWDVSNRKGASPSFREVVVEESLDVEEEDEIRKRRPDYSFRTGGQPRFFVEAKTVDGRNLKFDHRGARQLRTYAWSARLPVGILTNFDQFIVYDTRFRPRTEDTADVAVIAHFSWTQAADLWAFFEKHFSRDAVLRGSLDAFVRTLKSKRGTIEVDAAFLDDIEQWRSSLALDLARRNTLSQQDLNLAVQRIIDRIIFLRIAEDRGLEPYGTLRTVLDEAISGQNRAYSRLVDIFRRLDGRFNSGLFHFEEEEGREETPDLITPGLKVGDRVLREIISGLYYPQSSYRFAVMPAEILGHVYEQFLGKIIEMPTPHEAVVREKLAVRKAGGVYYTPSYIVREIVSTTLAPLLRDKTPEEVSKLRILDPACGSGSFLIEVYQYLLNWHLEWYTQNANKRRKGPSPVYEDSHGDLKLTSAERKRIVLNNIFGVDIDQQAVEVTKLSLFLKVLETESGGNLDAQQRLGIRALPDLGKNIMCGNSLIDSSIYDGVRLSDIDDELRSRINVFDWNRRFRDVFGRDPPGFDAIVGNPPYIRVQTLNQVADLENEHYKRHYRTAAEGNYDIYAVFVERSLSLLRPTGRLGFILPHKFFNAKYGKPLRELLAEARLLSRIVHFGDQQVFQGASTYTALLFLDKAGGDNFTFVRAHDLESWRTLRKGFEGTIPAAAAKSDEWNFVVGEGRKLFDRLREWPVTLKDETVTTRIFQGIKTSADKIYIVEERSRKKGQLTIYSEQLEKPFQVEPDLFHPLIKGGDVKRYRITPTNRLILFPYVPGKSGKFELIAESVLERKFPLTYDYLLANRDALEQRERGRMRGPKWYGYIYPKALDVMGLSKIFTPDIAPSASFARDDEGSLFFTGGAAGGYGILPAPGVDPDYLLGLLNSRLLEWFIRQSATTLRGGWFSFESRFIGNLPIELAEERSDASTRERITEISRAVQLGYKRLSTMLAGHEKTLLARQIEGLESEIDRRVYALYGLSDDEVRHVEAEVLR